MSEEAIPWHVLVDPENLDIDGLAESALRSFAVIQPWCKPRQLSSHHLVVATAEKIMKQADEYGRAIDKSLYTAQKGCEFADDAIELCNFVSTGEACIEHLEAFLREMLDKANMAHTQALAMDRQFAGVRSSFFQIAKSIPSDVKRIEEEKKLEVTSGVVHVPSPATKKSLRLSKDKANQISSQIAGTMTKSFDNIILQLEHAGNDLTDLAGYVGNFVNWWSDMKIGLGSLQSSIPLIKLDGSNPLRQEVVLKRWQRFRGQYVQYQRRISVITDYYPKSEERLLEEARRSEAKRQEAERLEKEQLEEKHRQEAKELAAKRLEEERILEAKRQEAKRQEEEQLEEERPQEEDRLEENRQLEEERLEAKRLEESRREAKRLREEWLEEKHQQEEKRLEEKRQEEQLEENRRQDAERLERLYAENLEANHLEEKRLEEAKRLERRQEQLEEQRRQDALRLEEKREKKRQEEERLEALYTKELEANRLEEKRRLEAKGLEEKQQEESSEKEEPQAAGCCGRCVIM